MTFEDALCRQADPEAWFPEKGQSAASAKKICAQCPLKAACLEYALDHPELVGVWGGANERERRETRTQRRYGLKEKAADRIQQLAQERSQQ